MNPRVSVVMGVYNDAAFLAETVESVLAQTMADFEFIIVNDGSTEQGVQLQLDAYAQADARIRPVTKVNEGLTVALMLGCQQASGEYIARIDVGDKMSPHRLERQRRVLDGDGSCSFVSSHTAFYGPRWEKLWVNTGRCPGDAPASILPVEPGGELTGDVSHHGSVMFRRSAYEAAGGYRREFYYAQDWDLWLRLATQGTFFVIPEVLYHARIAPGGISMRNADRQRELAACFRGAFTARQLGQDEGPWLERAAAIRPAAKATGQAVGARASAQAAAGLYFVGEGLRRNANPQCRHYLIEAIRANPREWRAYLRWLQSLVL